MDTLTSAHHNLLEAKSRETILRFQSNSGAYPASPGFSAYDGYSWLRDGAFISFGMSQAKEFESSEKFLSWCVKTIESMESTIDGHFENFLEGGQFDRARYLPTRFEIGATQDIGEEWPNFQIDGYGTWIWSLAKFNELSRRDVSFAKNGVGLSVKYLLAVWKEACFDWWEEHPDERHSSTLGSCIAGLRSALKLNLLDDSLAEVAGKSLGEMESLFRDWTSVGYIPKWHGDERIDGSALALLGPLEVVSADDNIFRGTLTKADEDLLRDFGVHRYLGDVYYGGGLWPLLSAFYGLAAIRLGEVDLANSVLDWIAGTQGVDGELPEQINMHLLAPEQEDFWIQKWGPSANPLLWSHGMYLALFHELRRV